MQKRYKASGLTARRRQRVVVARIGNENLVLVPHLATCESVFCRRKNSNYSQLNAKLTVASRQVRPVPSSTPAGAPCPGPGCRSGKPTLPWKGSCRGKAPERARLLQDSGLCDSLGF